MNHPENLVKLVADEIAANFSKPTSHKLEIPPFTTISENRSESSSGNNGHSIVYAAVYLAGDVLYVESRHTDKRDPRIRKILEANFPQGNISYTPFDQPNRPVSTFKVEY